MYHLYYPRVNIHVLHNKKIIGNVFVVSVSIIDVTLPRIQLASDVLQVVDLHRPTKLLTRIKAGSR